MVSLVLDIGILLLLIATLSGGYRLHKKLQAFQIETKEIEPLIQSLDHAAKCAEAVLADFRSVAEDLSTKLSTEANDTQRLLDDLDFMTKRADQLADTLENAISDARRQERQQLSAEPEIVTEISDMVQTTAPRDQRRRVPDLEKRLKSLR